MEGRGRESAAHEAAGEDDNDGEEEDPYACLPRSVFDAAVPWGHGRAMRHARMHPENDAFMRRFVAELHEEDISELNLSASERVLEAAKWEVLLEPCTNELYYGNHETLETRWNLPRGLRYADLHSHNRTAHLCALVLPDALPPDLRSVDWRGLIVAARAGGDWTAYRAARERVVGVMRVMLLTQAPGTRVYLRLAEPYRFEGEIVCDDPEDADPDVDIAADSLEQLGFRVTALPRYVWVRVPTSDNGWNGGLYGGASNASTFVEPDPAPHEYLDAEFVARENAFCEEWMDRADAARAAYKEQRRKEREQRRAGGGDKTRLPRYRQLQIEHNILKKEAEKERDKAAQEASNAGNSVALVRGQEEGGRTHRRGRE